jgi:hypothetical protein
MLLPALALLLTAADPASSAAPKPPGDPAAVAVVELYTSEGCSSCPPADRALAEIGREHAADGRVVLLAFHVDYWDRLGWPDRLASPAASDRQRRLASLLAAHGREEGGAGVYTPQAVVNGRLGLVGSRAERLRAAITDALANPATVRLEITGARPVPTEARPRAVAVQVKLAPRTPRPGAALPETALLTVAITENGLTTAVKHGENAGATLHHDHAVRAFADGQSVPLPPADAKPGVEPSTAPPAPTTVSVDLPADAHPDRCEVAVVLQDPRTLHVLGAARTKLDAPVPPRGAGAPPASERPPAPAAPPAHRP